MPYVVHKHGRKWAIVNRSTGKVAGYSTSKRNAQRSASIRNSAHRSTTRSR